jgi:hypothetical protein
VYEVKAVVNVDGVSLALIRRTMQGRSIRESEVSKVTIVMNDFIYRVQFQSDKTSNVKNQGMSPMLGQKSDVHRRRPIKHIE